jgi:hypothetical protein
MDFSKDLCGTCLMEVGLFSKYLDCTQLMEVGFHVYLERTDLMRVFPKISMDLGSSRSLIPESTSSETSHFLGP